MVRKKSAPSWRIRPSWSPPSPCKLRVKAKPVPTWDSWLDTVRVEETARSNKNVLVRSGQALAGNPYLAYDIA